MALSVSIYLDDLDLRSTYGIEILAVDDPWGTARFAASLLDVPLRDGAILTRGKFEPRRITLKGYIKAASHAALMTALDALKTKIHPQGEGLGKVRLKFADTTDRWFRGYFENIKLGPPFKAWRIAAAVNIELTFVCVEALGEGDAVDVAYTESLSTIASFKYDNIGTGISQPIIMLISSGESLTTLSLINTATIHREKIITATLGGAVDRAPGHSSWSGSPVMLYGGVYPQTTDSSMIRIPGAGNFTPCAFQIMMWIQRKFDYNDSVQHYFFSTNNDLIRLYTTTGVDSTIVFEIDGVYTYMNDNVLTKDTWMPVRCTYDGTWMDMQIGQASGDRAEKSYKTQPTQIYIGSDATSLRQADSYLDEIRILNRVDLNISEEFRTMNSPMPMHKGTLVYMDFDKDCNGKGWLNTELNLNFDSPVESRLLILDCHKMSAIKRSKTNFAIAPVDIIENTSGEFPYLLPGINNFLLNHNDNLAITAMVINRPRYL